MSTRSAPVAPRPRFPGHWRPLVRGVVRQAALWGAAGSAMGAAIGALGAIGRGMATAALREAAILTVGGGVLGAGAGVLFAVAMRALWRGRDLERIRPWRFGAAAAVVSGVGVPLVMQLLNVLSGDGVIAWRLVLDDGPLFAVFGGVMATVSLLAARRARRAERAAGLTAPVGGTPLPAPRANAAVPRPSAESPVVRAASGRGGSTGAPPGRP